jgi:hypothetical protein
MYSGFVKPLLQVLTCVANQGHVGGLDMILMSLLPVDAKVDLQTQRANARHDLDVSSTLGASSNLLPLSYSPFGLKLSFT